jgi:hypothetical protein
MGWRVAAAGQRQRRVRDGIRHQVANDNDAGHGRHHLIIKRLSGRAKP